MISVEQALGHLFKLVSPLGVEMVPIDQAGGRVLARPVAARLTQPPFDASSMDGYAIRAEDARPGATLKVSGESAAGRRHQDPVRPGEAVRIFTGAPMPPGADRVVIQEDVERKGGTIVLRAAPGPGENVRPAGNDFRLGDTLSAPRRLGPAALALAAAMNHAELPCHRRPEIAVISTGDELVEPGQAPGPDQIVASNVYGLKAMLEAEGARVRRLPIAGDTIEELQAVLDMARGTDMIVTIGGASAGDRDVIARAAETLGIEQDFYKVAMRPGKPLMAGRLAGTPMIGLPGNPVSALVCGVVFVVPTVRVMMGLPAAAQPRDRVPLAADVGPNGPREHYMRAMLEAGSDGAWRVRPFARQDSALLSVLSAADALLVRPPGDAPRRAGEVVEIIRI